MITNAPTKLSILQSPTKRFSCNLENLKVLQSYSLLEKCPDKHHGNVFKAYLISFLMISKLIDFALVVLQLLVFKVRRIIGISKIVFFIFFGTEGSNKI